MNVLVIGYGLAGAWLVRSLQEAGAVVTVADAADASSASRVAAGIINPLTGKRLKPTWEGELLWHDAVREYRRLEQDLGIDVFRRLRLRRVFRDQESPRWFEKRHDDPERAWMTLEAMEPGTHDGIRYPFGGYEQHEAAAVDIPALLDAGRMRLADAGAYVQVAISPDEIVDHGDTVVWNGRSFDTVIWCEGHTMLRHPLWSWLPLEPVKGEILDVEIPGFDVPYIVSSGIWCVPDRNDTGRYRIGSTYDWDHLDVDATDAARRTLLDDARDLFGRDIVVHGQRAGIRPAAKSKRPFLGRHPERPCHAIMNGLGTKGSLLAPYFARQLARHLVLGEALHPETTVLRWWNHDVR